MSLLYHKSKGFVVFCLGLCGIALSLSNGDEIAVLKNLEMLATAILNPIDYFVAKCTYQLLTNIFVFAMTEANCNTTGIRVPLFQEQDIETLYLIYFPHSMSLLARRINEAMQNESQTLEEEIKTCIDEQLNNPMLCINTIIETFHISAPTLQKRLHTAVGLSFSAYVEQQRMTKARELLHTKTMTIQEIASQCGYTSANTFNKAYKRYYGETPKGRNFP